MFQNVGKKKIGFLGLSLLALLFVFPSLSVAQGMYGMGGMGGMGGGMGGMGGGMGGMYGMGGMGMGAQGPGQVFVKYGEKVYDAVFGDLVDYKVYNIPMGADQIGVNYYDDGTHGDEIPYDGMPSLITINRDTYLGPFSIKYKLQLKKALEHAEKMGALRFYNLQVASDIPGSKVNNLEDWQRQLGDVLENLRARLAQFEGYDDEKYIKSVDPSTFEALEGFGSMQASMAPGGYLPDLPPPPGIQLQPQEGMEGMDMMGDPGQGAEPQESGRFNPIQRARNAAGSADALSGGMLQATEAMNELP